MALNLVRYARPRSRHVTAFGWGLSYAGLITSSRAVPRCSSRRRPRPRPRTSSKPQSPIPSIVPVSAPDVPVPASLGATVKKKVQNGATRKAFELLESSQSDATAADFRTAVRAFIRADRIDLALETFRMREKSEHISLSVSAADPAVPAAVLRACLRGRKDEAYKRDVRRDLAVGTKEALRVLLRDVKNLREVEDDNNYNNTDPIKSTLPILPGPYAAALCQVQIALLKFGDTDSAIEALIAMDGLNRYGKLAAVKVTDYNELIRQYGKARNLDAVFTVMDAMRSTYVEATHETFEFLANSAVRSVEFVKGAVSIDTLPDPLKAEVAFAGRSNVGKSSLVNMLCNRKTLAKVSGTPGKTQQFNYFNVNIDGYFLVDLPGVGYAKVSKDLRSEWKEFMYKYFSVRKELRVLFHLIDGRHGALEDDEMLMDMVAQSGYTGEYVVVLTKMDKMDKQKVKAAVMRKVQEALIRNGGGDYIPIVATSAETKLGRDELWRFLQQALRGTVTADAL